MYIPFGFVNLPAHADKKKLVLPKFRAPRMIKWAKENKRSVVGVVELSTISRIYIACLPGWGMWNAKFNNDFGEIEVGSTVIWDKHDWTFVRAHTLHFAWKGHPRGLNMPCVLLENNQTGEKCWFIAWHAPRMTLDAAMNLRVWEGVHEEAMRLFAETGFPVATGGDGNAKRAHDADKVGMSIGMAMEVLLIAGYGIEWGTSGADQVTFSDHVAMRANGKS